VIVVVLANQ
jgi:hypothetical protein